MKTNFICLISDEKTPKDSEKRSVAGSSGSSSNTSSSSGSSANTGDSIGSGTSSSTPKLLSPSTPLSTLQPPTQLPSTTPLQPHITHHHHHSTHRQPTSASPILASPINSDVSIKEENFNYYSNPSPGLMTPPVSTPNSNTTQIHSNNPHIDSFKSYSYFNNSELSSLRLPLAGRTLQPTSYDTSK